MDTLSKDINRQWWHGQAKRTARRINLAWWMETLSTPLVFAGLAGAASLLVIRNHAVELPLSILCAACVGVVLLIGLVCWIVAARRFEKPDRSLVRIEATMEMKNALSAASAGVAPWPEPVPEVNPGVRWHWPRIVLPPLAALALLSAGLLIPVSSAKSPTAPPEQPQAWKQLDSSLEHLSKEELVDEKYLEETRKKLEELKAQNEEQWFSHSSLEATDSLKKEHRSEMDRVEQELERAEKALESLEKNGGANQAEKERQLNEFQQAMQGLQNGAMKPNPALLEQLKQLDPNKLGQLTKEQMEQLRENLKKNAEGMKKGPGDGQADDWSDELLADENGDGQGNGNGDKPGEGSGKGGVNRGPGHDPGVLGNDKDGLETGDLTAVESRDLSNALPGDLLQLQDGEHDVDKSGSKITLGGDTNATGAGGDRVWRDSLDPGEQKTLKRFFE
jgi:hypothetical protein